MLRQIAPILRRPSRPIPSFDIPTLLEGIDDFVVTYARQIHRAAMDRRIAGFPLPTRHTPLRNAILSRAFQTITAAHRRHSPKA